MRTARNEIENANQAIERTLSNLDFQSRGAVSQDIVNNLRNLVEHVAVLAVYRDAPISGRYYDAIRPSLESLKSQRSTRFIWDFHHLLQKVVSHYTPAEDSSERLMLKYYEYLVQIKTFASSQLGVDILANLDKFPLDMDPGLSGYYEQIAQKIDCFMIALSPEISSNRYYIHSEKPFFVRGRVYYELALIPAYDVTSKHDHVIAFAPFRVPTNCSISVSLKTTSINALGARLPITVIDDWRASIRPCELNFLNRVLGKSTSVNVTGGLRSYKSLMDFLTHSGYSLDEIAALPQDDFQQIASSIERSGQNCPIHALLTAAHEHVFNMRAGNNVLKYLLYKPRNRVIKCQLDGVPNNKLGGLYLKNGCIPFERQPYCTALIAHEVSSYDLFRCIDPEPYEDNHLARFIMQRTRDAGILYVDESEASGFANIDGLVDSYNRTLWHGHSGREISHDMGQLCIRGDEEDAVYIIKALLTLAEKGFGGYEAACDAWLNNNPSRVDDPEKRDALRKMFASTKVAFIYGSAGTGKTTMADIVCASLPRVPKMAIANTNPAVDSLRRRLDDSSCEFQTIAKYLHNPLDCTLLIVDECSTVSNRDMKQIIELGKFKLLLLIGDIRQIEAIRLGNWFGLAREFMPDKCIHEFERPWRATNEDLALLWPAVRENKPEVAEILESCGMTSPLDDSIRDSASDDEVVLCLNYDGLYGINNINRLMQGANPSKPEYWDLHTYKIGDPVLFNETNRFHPLLYNNLKGWITNIDKKHPGEITFEVAIDAAISEIQVLGYEGLEYIDCVDGKTILRFTVYQSNDPDEEEREARCIVPFQVAYAVSVHKAQGLEYASVKIIVTKDVEKRITHNIFYTAITRAREKLKIYWSPESQQAVLSSLTLSASRKDAMILSNRYGLNLNPSNR